MGILNIFKKPSSIERLVRRILKDYRNRVQLQNSDLGIILEELLFDRYPESHKLHELAKSNKNHLVDLQSLVYCILNMEYPGGRDLDQLIEMYIQALKELAKLGHGPSIAEWKILKKVEEKAKNSGNDEEYVISQMIKMGFLHKRDDFDQIFEKMFD